MKDKNGIEIVPPRERKLTSEDRTYIDTYYDMEEVEEFVDKVITRGNELEGEITQLKEEILHLKVHINNSSYK